MTKNNGPQTRKIVRWTFWGIIIAITLFWLVSQQLELNRLESQKERQARVLQEKQERSDELETEDASLSDEDVKRSAQSDLGLIPFGHTRIEIRK